MTKRDIEIEIGKLVMRLLAKGAKPDDLLEAFQARVKEELSLRESRKAAARFY